jgi:hypothetical protein
VLRQRAWRRCSGLWVSGHLPAWPTEEEKQLKRFILLACAGLAVVGALAGIATATPPTHTTSTFSASSTAPAGTFCDFNLGIDFTITNDVTTFSDGSGIGHDKGQTTYTNVDTGAVVTGTEVVEGHFAAGGTETDTGRFLKLRDASGKVVSVKVGKLVFDSSFQVVGFTPNADPNPRAVICPALGGNPA